MAFVDLNLSYVHKHDAVQVCRQERKQALELLVRQNDMVYTKI